MNFTKRLVLFGVLIAIDQSLGFQPPQYGARARLPIASTSRNAATCHKAQYMASEPSQNDETSSKLTVRDRLRKATGFSLTAFRAAWRAATGISLTAVYGTAVAASGLWIRKFTSAVLSVFPAWFRYFLQPFLVLYYFPMFIIRGLTGPTRKEAKAKHVAVKESWRDAIDFAKATEEDGYWPVKVNEKGDFELVSPPQPKDTDKEDLADAVADSVEQAMEQGYNQRNEDGSLS
mmetsp:Transcript_23184/g.66537  ORF Transcript_23184/g.66537 Transcript_23184/m.66537 type:complete len:233 (-) Transcript_23184:59-757(-)